MPLPAVLLERRVDLVHEHGLLHLHVGVRGAGVDAEQGRAEAGEANEATPENAVDGGVIHVDCGQGIHEL